MIKNYIIIAWRNLFRNKAFSLINILGLALGMTCSLLIMLWVHDEKSIDGFHENDANLYSIYERQYHDGIIDAGHQAPGVLVEELKNKFPEVKYATHHAWNDVNTFEANGKILKERGNYGGADFFNVFTFPLIEGSASSALKSLSDIAISRKMAEDFFGSPEKAIGQSIRFDNTKDLKVTAVFENITNKSSMRFDYLLNWEVFLEKNSWARDWNNNGPLAYVVLQGNVDVTDFRNRLKDFLDLYRKKDENFRVELDIQKYSDIYLHSNFTNGEATGGRIQYVILFSIVAIFILVIACVNFMNLSTARSIKRAKEIGIRKVVGAVRGSLIWQFIGEAFLTVAFAFALSIMFVMFLLPLFNMITQKQIVFPVNSFYFWLSFGGLALLTGLVSGSYPALYLSSFKPVSVLKGSTRFSGGTLQFRKGLVVFQFVLSIVLIVGTIVISMQVDYVQSINLGYDRQDLIYVPLEGSLIDKYQLFKEQALLESGVKSVTRMSAAPSNIQPSTDGVIWEGKDPNSKLQFSFVATGYDFLKTLNGQMVQGRDFSKDFASDSIGYIINEKAANIIGYKDPVGMPLTFWDKKGAIVGVMKDVHFNSLHTPIDAIVIRLGENLEYGTALIRVDGSKTKEALASLEKICKQLNPQFPFTYQFSDDEYQKLYKSEQIVSKLSNAFAFLGIFISCLGLLGLAMFTAEQRTKEIGVRKVLGASLHSLFGLLSKELIVLVTISLLIASPLAWYIMENWLKDYAYRIELSWWMFTLAGGSAMIIALVTVSFQTVKALLENPVESLRAE